VKRRDVSCPTKAKRRACRTTLSRDRKREKKSAAPFEVTVGYWRDLKEGRRVVGLPLIGESWDGYPVELEAAAAWAWRRVGTSRAAA